LRRIMIIGAAAVAVLAVAGVAYAAAFNTYSAKLTFSPSKAGSQSKASPLAFTENLGAKGTGGNRAAPLVDIKTTIYGIRTNAGKFPTCSASKITSNPAKWDKACPKGSLVATGPVHALLGPAAVLNATGSPCNPFLHVYNGGGGKLVFFFVIIPPKYTCATLQTGASAPYIGHVKQVGKNLVTDVPLPPDVSTKAGGLTGVYGSLITEALTFKKLTKKVKGKTVGFNESFACKKGKRPYVVQYTSVEGGVRETPQIVHGSAKC
jgi:hypothetical protein